MIMLRGSPFSPWSDGRPESVTEARSVTTNLHTCATVGASGLISHCLTASCILCKSADAVSSAIASLPLLPLGKSSTAKARVRIEEEATDGSGQCSHAASRTASLRGRYRLNIARRTASKEFAPVFCRIRCICSTVWGLECKSSLPSLLATTDAVEPICIDAKRPSIPGVSALIFESRPEATSTHAAAVDTPS